MAPSLEPGVEMPAQHWQVLDSSGKPTWHSDGARATRRLGAPRRETLNARDSFPACPRVTSRARFNHVGHNATGQCAAISE